MIDLITLGCEVEPARAQGVQMEPILNDRRMQQGSGVLDVGVAPIIVYGVGEAA